MLAERESSFMMGSYERPRYEPAMIRLCALARDALHDRAKARACFDRVYRELTTSELRDDALWEEARLAREDGDAPASCAGLDRLVRELPELALRPVRDRDLPGIAAPGSGRAARVPPVHRAREAR